ncbi:MAG: hypothetical protein KJS97_16405 [Alphaproteobacteria bacterium]|nr:hypothetical protein [Alphaproteobacteria bacterium]
MLVVVGLFAPGVAHAAPPATSFTTFTPSAEATKVLLLDPQVDIQFLTTSGPEKRADWNEMAKANMIKAVTAELQATKETVVRPALSADQADAAQQIILLQQAVTAAMPMLQPLLPHQRKHKETYTIGPGAALLAGDTGADYAVLVDVRAVIESSGVFLTQMMISMATGVTPASQNFRGTSVSVFDLKSGELVWKKLVVYGDARTEAESADIARRIFDNGPFAGAPAAPASERTPAVGATPTS